jgi:aspartate ammonia-lyase
MGADEFSGLSDDQSAPAISYTILSNSCTTGRTITATIIDGTGVNTTQQNHVFIIKIDRCNSLTGWKFVEASNTTSPFSFTMDYSLIGGVTTGTTIQYFIVAQDVFLLL